MKKPLLKGENVVLRPITVEDAQAMFDSLSDEESMRLTGTQETFTFQQVQAFCKRVESAEDRLDYAITLPADPRYRGEVVLNDIDQTNRSAHFRIALTGAENRDKGYGSEAARLILDHAFNDLKLHRISLEVYAFNPRAIHTYRKLGFIQEGVLRDALYQDGEYHDAIQMGLLAPDWRTLKTRRSFEALETERLRIRRLRNSDLSAFVTYRNLPEIARLQLWDDYDEARGRALVNGCKVVEPFTPGDDFQFGVVLKDTDALIGDLYFKLDAAGKQAEIGYTFDPKFQGKGLATEAVRKLIDHAFKHKGLHRIYGVTDPRNTASIKLMERLGMRKEAHFKEDLWFKGAWADDVVYAVLETEWVG